jgi:superfamily II DNA or RNA helicase
VTAHLSDGAIIIGFSATPLDLESLYDHLVVAGTPTELRGCGALVLANHFGPDEPDLDAFRKQGKKFPTEGEDFSEILASTVMRSPTLFGRVSVAFEQTNPEHRATLLFAPGVRESLWFAEQFFAKGITAAHMAAGEVWMNGEWLATATPAEEQDSREKVLRASKYGSVVVICNRFLLREGIDASWLSHGILATVFGSVQSYLQSGGRLLRAAPGKTICTIQDHGGNWHRHGSLNIDRHWDLRYTAGMVYQLRADRIRSKEEPEPWRCPVCMQIQTSRRCKCGYRPGPKPSRPVVTTDEKLIELTGDIFRPVRIDQTPIGVKHWKQTYWRCKRAKLTFRQAIGLYARENGGAYPDPTWPLMPREEMDCYRLIADVAMDRLR